MTMLVYIAKTTFSLFLFYSLYRFIFKKEGIIKFNRYYLLFSLIASFLFPFLKLNINIAPDISNNINVIQYQNPFVINPEINPGIISDNITYDNALANQTNVSVHSAAIDGTQKIKPNAVIYSQIITKTAIGLYLFGVLILLLSFLHQSLRAIRLFKHNTIINFPKAKLIHHNMDIMPFSIFNYILINKDHYSEKELDFILLHEMVHINQKHSLDVLLVELLKIIFWINPFLWFYEREIKQNHEYLADRGVIEQGAKTYDYQLILLNSSLGVPKFNVVNNFNKSFIKKRITMMTNKKCNKLTTWKILLIIPVIIAIMIACANPSGNNSVGKSVETTSKVTDYTKLIEINTPYDWVCYQGGDFFCEGAITITKIDKDGNFEGFQENHTFESRNVIFTVDKNGKTTTTEGKEVKTNPIKGKLTKDVFEYSTGAPYNEIWKINESESGKLVGKVLADYNYSRKSRKTFYLAKHIGFEELLPESKSSAGNVISKNLHLKLDEKYFFETMLNCGFRGFTGWFMINTFNPNTNEISGHQGNFKASAIGAFNGKLYNDSIIINIGDPWDEVWKATLAGNQLKGTLSMQPKVKVFENQIGTHTWVMANSCKPIISVKKAEELNTPYNVARYSGMENELSSFIENNMKYPDQAKRDSIQGKVYVSFNILTDGSINNVKIERGVNPLLDNEALRLVNLTNKKWVPAVNDNQPIVSEYLLPVVFNLK